MFLENGGKRYRGFVRSGRLRAEGIGAIAAAAVPSNWTRACAQNRRIRSPQGIEGGSFDRI